MDEPIERDDQRKPGGTSIRPFDLLGTGSIFESYDRRRSRDIIANFEVHSLSDGAAETNSVVCCRR